jgi:hypothetical protein
MKKISVLALVVLMSMSCKDGEEKVEQENSVDKKEVDNSSNNNQVSEEDLGYTLGIRPDRAFSNMYGSDSIDAQGNTVYPPRDTIWDAE